MSMSNHIDDSRPPPAGVSEPRKASPERKNEFPGLGKSLRSEKMSFRASECLLRSGKMSFRASESEKTEIYN